MEEEYKSGQSFWKKSSLLIQAITITVTANYRVVSDPKPESFFRHLLFKPYKKIPALFSSLLEVGKLRSEKNKKRPQGHTGAEQVKKAILILCTTPHRCSGEVKLRTINIRKSPKQQLLNLKKNPIKSTSPEKISEKPLQKEYAKPLFPLPFP